MIKSLNSDAWKITDYTDFIGWHILAAIKMDERVNKEPIFYLELQREGTGNETLKIRRVFCEARYLPIDIWIPPTRKGNHNDRPNTPNYLAN